jgi:hypothetical protein
MLPIVLFFLAEAEAEEAAEAAEAAEAETEAEACIESHSKIWLFFKSFETGLQSEQKLTPLKSSTSF